MVGTLNIVLDDVTGVVSAYVCDCAPFLKTRIPNAFEDVAGYATDVFNWDRTGAVLDRVHVLFVERKPPKGGAKGKDALGQLGV